MKAQANNTLQTILNLIGVVVVIATLAMFAPGFVHVLLGTARATQQTIYAATYRDASGKVQSYPTIPGQSGAYFPTIAF